MDEFVELEDAPIEIIEELKLFGLKVGRRSGNRDGKLCSIGSNSFIQKENREKIKALESLGWQLERGTIREGIKYVSMYKNI